VFGRPYREVAERLDRWRADGQLVGSATSAVYVHEYTAAGLTVRGLVGALDISVPAASLADRAVVPHEGIHPEQVAELAERMSVWQLNPAPILLVHRGPPGVRELVERSVRKDPWLDFVDRADQRHRIWLLDDAAQLDAALAGSRALIADGHHRYAAYLRMHQSSSRGPADRGLAMLVDQADTPLFLGAIHRVLLDTTLEEVERACTGPTTFAPISAADAFAALSADTLVATDGRSWATLSVELPPDRAAVELLHDELLGARGLPEGRVAFHHSVEEALSRVRSADGVAVLVPAPDFDLVVRVAEAGRLLPEKATSFQPKPSVGVLIRSLTDG
jgi:uncharacterized protein (DUF1015 family)